eukprot:4579127-Pyramimonas_sp.AAC.1
MWVGRRCRLRLSPSSVVFARRQSVGWRRTSDVSLRRRTQDVVVAAEVILGVAGMENEGGM